MLSLSNLAVNRVMTFALSSNSGSFFESVNFANFSRSDRTSERFDLERPELPRPFFVDESQAEGGAGSHKNRPTPTAVGWTP